MSDYGRTSGTGGPQSAAITNDDEYTLTDLPENDDPKEGNLADFADDRYY